MIKTKILVAALVVTLCTIWNFWGKPASAISENEGGEAMEENIRERAEWMNAMLADPATGKIPADMRARELAFAATLPVNEPKYKSNAADDGFWQQRGPWNVGGRTRAIAIDKTNENILLAGGTTGGIWRSTNGGLNWTKVSNTNNMLNITALMQDSRSGKTQNWYAATGEYYGSYVPGAFYLGKGMYRSTDGGLTWTSITSTNTNTPQTFEGTWDFIHNIAINTTIDTAEVLYAATYNAVYRTINGGTTWNRVRGGGAAIGSSTWSDVVVTPTGVVYATLSGGGAHPGIWRSVNNGINWTNITPAGFPPSFARIVIGLSPSDEKQIYFLAHTPNYGKKTVDFQGREDWNSLWKYTYVSGDGTGTGGVWDDRSANIPGFGGDFGDFNSQQSYCLTVKVKPDNPDVVFIGSTNLYRSTDGFKTTTNSAWIGGYGVNTTRPDYQLYPNHHPDVHNNVFYPSNPSKMISLSDGGISRTNDNMAASVVWKSLNYGFITTQFYTVALDHATANNNIVTGGLQDNGTHFTNTQAYGASWTMSSNSDGSFCFVKDGGSEHYMSTQQGRVYRLILDASGNRTQLARLDPASIARAKYQFINPYTPDGGDWKRLYIPANNRLWRNSDVTAIPLKSTIDTNRVLTNWQELSNAALPDSADEITAIVSAGKIADVLYYGTMNGRVYKLRGASVGNPVPVEITGSNFPAGSYINCVAVNPADTSKLFVVFTNYNVQSVFYTENGGQSWTAVSGNLEQNSNGSGNGPSCRWLSVVHINGKWVYYLGTTTGLYATDSLNAMQTTWIKQSPGLIGDNIVTMMDYREADGQIVVATFGAGVFSAKLNSAHNITSVKNETAISVARVYPNPVVSFCRVEGLRPAATYSYKLMNAEGKLMQHGTLTRDGSEIYMQAYATGCYYLLLDDGMRTEVKKIIKY